MRHGGIASHAVALRSRRPGACADAYRAGIGRSCWCPSFGAGRSGKARSRTPDMYAGRKSDTVIVPKKDANKDDDARRPDPMAEL